MHARAHTHMHTCTCTHTRAQRSFRERLFDECPYDIFKSPIARTASPQCVCNTQYLAGGETACTDSSAPQKYNSVPTTVLHALLNTIDFLPVRSAPVESGQGERRCRCSRCKCRAGRGQGGGTDHRNTGSWKSSRLTSTFDHILTPYEEIILLLPSKVVETNFNM